MNSQVNNNAKRAIRKALIYATATAGVISAADVQADAFRADFNGDGYEDIVVADPSASINNKAGAGRILVIETDYWGLRPGVTAEHWHVDRLLNQGSAAVGDGFGTSIGVGDFNGDGFDDMAVGAPNEKVSTYYNSGTVRIIYGTANGLVKAGNQIMYGESIGYYHNFGAALTVADFDADGYEDLAVGVPGMPFGNQNNQQPFDGVGGVAVYFGSASGLSVSDYVILERADNWVAGYAESGSRFGAALAAGDVNGDGYADLLMGAPREDVWRNGKLHADAGSVTLIFGGPNGFISYSLEITDTNEYSNASDQFGSTLAVGYFNSDDYADYAIGHPSERVGSKYAAGAVSVFNGQASFGVGARTLWYQNRSGVPGTSEAGDRFGYSLTVGDFDNDGKDDLAIGIPYETHERFWGDKKRAGSVLTLYGSYAGLYVDSNASNWHQDIPNVAGGVETNDYFGWSLSSGDYNNDGIEDLLIGVSGEKVSGVSGRGIIQMITGSVGGLQPAIGQQQIFHGGNVSNGFGITYGKVLP